MKYDKYVLSVEQGKIIVFPLYFKNIFFTIVGFFYGKKNLFE